MPFSNDETLLIFRIADIPFAVPAQSVGSILMPPEHITHTPGSARSTPGIFHHAQFTYAVIDMHNRFGIDTARIGVGRLLLQEDGIRHYAFLVDQVVGLVRSEQGKWANLPRYLPQELFSAGFLYQDEIVLCTELSLLRNMHDVEPLRHHFAQLQQQKKTSQEKNDHQAEISNEKTAATIPPAEPVAETSIEQKPLQPESRPPTKEKAETKSESPEKKISMPVSSPPTPKQQKATPIPPTKPLAQTSAEKPAVAKSEEPFRATTEMKSRTRIETPPPASPPPQPAATNRREMAYEEKDNSLLWMLLFLLLLSAIPIGYWLWPQSEPPRLSPPVATISPPSRQPITEEPPLRIERDENGTINLIIDRQAVAKATPAPMEVQTPAPAEETTTEQPTNVEQQTSAAESSVESNVAATETVPEEQPAIAETTQPEPCDCTHTVVKGDTLWDIAEFYTGNAFNYPELAKRSGIKNPDRIYPGNKVRIIIR